MASDRYKQMAREMTAMQAAYERKIDAMLEKIADDYFGIKTLKEQGNDALDFHENHVNAIRCALRRAYDAGISKEVGP